VGAGDVSISITIDPFTNARVQRLVVSAVEEAAPWACTPVQIAGLCARCRPFVIFSAFEIVIEYETFFIAGPRSDHAANRGKRPVDETTPRHTRRCYANGRYIRKKVCLH
jgi:hypothetical protein